MPLLSKLGCVLKLLPILPAATTGQREQSGGPKKTRFKKPILLLTYWAMLIKRASIILLKATIYQIFTACLAFSWGLCLTQLSMVIKSVSSRVRLPKFES